MTLALMTASLSLGRHRRTRRVSGIRSRAFDHGLDLPIDRDSPSSGATVLIVKGVLSVMREAPPALARVCDV